MEFLDNNYKELIAVTLVLVLYLVWKEPNLNVDFNLSKADGFTADDSGSSMRFAQRRDDAGYSATTVTQGTKVNPIEGMMGREPPVFWNAGNYEDVRELQKGLPVNASDYNVLMTDGTQQEGMSRGMYGRKGEAYEGMANRFSDVSLLGSNGGL